MTRIARSVVLVGAWGMIACAKHQEPAPAEAAKSEPEPAVAVEVAAQPEPPPPPPPPEPVAEPEPEAAPPPPPPPPDHAAEIHPKPGVTEWKELPGLAEITGFYPFVIGVLAECGLDGSQYCKLYDDGRLEVTEVDLGGTPVWGIWRSDAWQIERSDREEESDDDRAPPSLYEILEIKRWRGSSFTLQKKVEGALDIDSYDDHYGYAGSPVVRKGWAGGMLVFNGAFMRVPDSGPPAPRVSVPLRMVDFFEAESGAMFLVTHPEDSYALDIHPPCASGSCADQILHLPADEEEEYWNLYRDVARGGDSLSVLAGSSSFYLIHYDAPAPGSAGAWRFEELPAGPLPSIWPDTRGGLWLSISDALWYRDKAGKWWDVELPGVAIDFANRLKPREFLALVEGEVGNRVFATRGPIKPRPASATEP